MKYDPISVWLLSIHSVICRVFLFLAVVLIGSMIPQVWHGGNIDWPWMLAGFPFTLMLACVTWGQMWWPLCLLAWLAIPVLFCFFYSYVFEQAPKRDLFLGFSITFFIFLGTASESYEKPLLVFGIVALVYWGLPLLLKRR